MVETYCVDVLCYTECWWRCGRGILIHLMLMFYDEQIVTFDIENYFNTSYVDVLYVTPATATVAKGDFNTSYVDVL